MPTKAHKKHTTRAAVAAEVLKPALQWNTARYSVVISFIDPCCPIDEFHTDHPGDARLQFLRWKERMRKHSGEWSLEWWEHPVDANTTRKVMRYCPRGWIYFVEFPRSRSVHRYSYMEASSDNAKKYKSQSG